MKTMSCDMTMECLEGDYRIFFKEKRNLYSEEFSLWKIKKISKPNQFFKKSYESAPRFHKQNKFKFSRFKVSI